MLNLGLLEFMSGQAEHGDEIGPILEEGSDLNSLRQQLLDGLASPISGEPWDAHYFEKLRERIRIRANEEISRQHVR